MGFKDQSIFLKICLVLLILALIFVILATALPYWLSYGNFHSGLWKSCFEIAGSKTCRDIGSATDWLDAVRAFNIIGLLVIVAAIVVCIIIMFVKDMKMLKLINFILCFVAFACIFIAFCVFAGEANNSHYSGAFACDIIGGILCLPAGILGLLAWMGK